MSVKLTDKHARTALFALQCHVSHLKDRAPMLEGKPELLAINQQLQAQDKTVIDKLKQELGE